MKQFACGDVAPSCGHVFTAPTVEGILATASKRPADSGGRRNTRA